MKGHTKSMKGHTKSMKGHTKSMKGDQALSWALVGGQKEERGEEGTEASISLTPPPRPQSPRIGFWRRRLRFFWALAGKARRRVCVYCRLRASWSELAVTRLAAARGSGLVYVVCST
jgi:hypothetical protein